MSLTGRFTFHRTWTGKVLLQVEEEVKSIWPMSRSKPYRRRWRNAKLMDLAAPELRAVMDLRYKPQFMAQYQHLAADLPAAEPGQDSAPTRYDGIPVAAGQLLAGKAPTREMPRDVTVEVQSFPEGISGRA
jgi:hypothetical protein